jgi:hypothetical protein
VWGAQRTIGAIRSQRFSSKYNNILYLNFIEKV